MEYPPVRGMAETVNPWTSDGLVLEEPHGVSFRGLKAQLQPMHGPKRLRSVQTTSTGYALVQNIRRDHHDLATDTSPQFRLAAVFTEVAAVI